MFGLNEYLIIAYSSYIEIEQQDCTGTQSHINQYKAQRVTVTNIKYVHYIKNDEGILKRLHRHFSFSFIFCIFISAVKLRRWWSDIYFNR